MSHQELVKCAREFRRGILGRRSSASMCFAVCAPLAGFLSAFGIEAELVEADFGYINHFWLELPSGDILDPTADQFGLAPVYLGPLPEQYKRLMANTSVPA